MKEKFINQYPLSKTLQFSLIPIGKTEEFFNERMLEEDIKRNENYPKMKAIMDRYHKDYIERALTALSIKGININEYSELYYITKKSDEDKEKLETITSSLRSIIAKELKNSKEYASLIKPGDFIKNLLTFR